MHRTIGYLSKRFVQVRAGEGRKVFLTFLYFFLVITAYYVVKPVSRSLVLDELGHRLVPYADLICAILMGPIVTTFARLTDRLAKPRLVSLSFVAVIAVTVLFWKLLAWPLPWIAGAFYVWVSIFSVLIVTLFWLVANDLYRPREAKRLFGFIGSGGILGGMTGSAIAAVGAQLIGTEHLLLLSAGILVLCWVVVQRLWHVVPERALAEAPRRGATHHETFFSDLGGFARLLLRSHYLLLLIALVGLSKLVSTLIYYQFNPFIEHTFTSVDAKTTFTGMFFGGINLLAFVIQFFCTSWILRRWGLLTTLLILPLGLLGGSIGLFWLPVFSIAAGLELYDHSFNYSLNNTAKEVLYLPIDRTIRYKVKPFIDMVVFRFSKGIAAVAGIILLDALGLPAQVLCALTIPLLAVWLVVAIRMRAQYTTTIRTILHDRRPTREAHAPEDRRIPTARARRAEILRALTTTSWATQKLSLAARLVAELTNSSDERRLLEGLQQYETLPVPSQGQEVSSAVDSLKQIIQDRTQAVGVRRQAIQALARQSDQESLDYFCGMLLVDEEAAIRDEVLRALTALRVTQPARQFPAEQIRRQVAWEVKCYERIAQVAAVYRQHHHGPLPSDDPVLGLLRILMEETVERVFRLLALLYRPEDVCLVYEQMQASDTYVRADALELLDNLVDSGMRSAIFPILDEDQFLALSEEAAIAPEPEGTYGVLREAIWDHNTWVSVTTLCAVGRLQLSALQDELEHASRHPSPVVSTAAKIALHLTTNP